MAIVTDYKCLDCGMELVDDAGAFIWDNETNETKDFLILMNTCHWLDDGKINGNVSETYCSKCNKYVKVYSILEVKEEISNPCEVVMEGIKNYIGRYGDELEKLKDIKKRANYSITKEDNHYVVKIPDWEDFYYSSYMFSEMTKEEVIEDALKDFHEEIDDLIEQHEETYQKYLNSNYLVVENSNRLQDDYNPLEKVNCPVCDNEIYKYVNGEVPCPRCGSRLIGCNVICYD